MQLTTLFLSLFLATMALAAPLLTKRELYNIDGEPVPDFQMETDKTGRIIPPADWPCYDSLDIKCEAHRNYIPRISVGKWRKECVSKIYQWKVDHNVFESRELAAEAKANEEQRRQIEEQKRQNMLRDCRRTSKTAWCRTLLAKDSKKKKEEEEAEKQEAKAGEEGGDGVKEAVA